MAHKHNHAADEKCSANIVPERKPSSGSQDYLRRVIVHYINTKNLTSQIESKSPFLRPLPPPPSIPTIVITAHSHVRSIRLLSSPGVDRGRQHPPTCYNPSLFPQATDDTSLVSLSRTCPDLSLGRLRQVIRRPRTPLQPSLQRPYRPEEY